MYYEETVQYLQGKRSYKRTTNFGGQLTINWRPGRFFYFAKFGRNGNKIECLVKNWEISNWRPHPYNKRRNSKAYSRKYLFKNTPLRYAYQGKH